MRLCLPFSDMNGALKKNPANFALLATHHEIMRIFNDFITSVFLVEKMVFLLDASSGCLLKQLRLFCPLSLGFWTDPRNPPLPLLLTEPPAPFPPPPFFLKPFVRFSKSSPGRIFLTTFLSRPLFFSRAVLWEKEGKNEQMCGTFTWLFDLFVSARRQGRPGRGMSFAGLHRIFFTRLSTESDIGYNSSKWA